MPEKETGYIGYIKSIFPQMDLTDIGFNFTDDPYNDLMVINGKTVIKFSRYDWTVAFLENEVDMVSFLKKYVSLPLPNMERLKKGAAKYDLPEGVPLTRERLFLLKRRQQEAVAEQISTFLQKMHSIPMKSAETYPWHDSSVARPKEEWLTEYEQLRQKVYPYCDVYTKNSIDLVFKPLIKNDSFLTFKPAIIHADLSPQHLIFDEKTNQLSGVMGFALAGIGDPAYDLSVLLNHFGETFVRRIGQYYRTYGNTIDRARFYAFAERLSWIKKVADMITTRDFSQFRFCFHAGDILPIGCGW